MTTLSEWCRKCKINGDNEKCVKCLKSSFNVPMIKEPIGFVEKKINNKNRKADINSLKQVGFLGITNIPLYERVCEKCGKVMNTVSTEKVVYCLDCKPFPIRCC